MTKEERTAAILKVREGHKAASVAMEAALAAAPNKPLRRRIESVQSRLSALAKRLNAK